MTKFENRQILEEAREFARKGDSIDGVIKVQGREIIKSPSSGIIRYSYWTKRL